MAHQPFGEALRMLDAHATKAEIAFGLREQVLVRRIVKEDAVIVDESELHLAHHVGRAGELADMDLDIAGSNRLPVNVLGSIGNSLVPPNAATVW